MLYAKVNGKEILEYPVSEQELRSRLSNISFPAGTNLADYAREYGYVPVLATKPPTTDKPGMQIALDTPVWSGTDLLRTFKEEEMPPRRAFREWREIRKRRNLLLKNSDWTQLADAPLSKAQKTAWKEYRAKLRDITDAEDPFKVVFPSPPSAE